MRSTLGRCPPMTNRATQLRSVYRARGCSSMRIATAGGTTGRTLTRSRAISSSTEPGSPLGAITQAPPTRWAGCSAAAIPALCMIGRGCSSTVCSRQVQRLSPRPGSCRRTPRVGGARPWAGPSCRRTAGARRGARIGRHGGERRAGLRCPPGGEDRVVSVRGAGRATAHDDQRLQARDCALEPGPEADQVAVAEIGLHEVTARAGVLGELADLALAVLGQGADRDDPGLDAAVVGDDGLGLVAELEHHAVACAQRRGGQQPGGEALAQLVELGVGQPGIDGDQCGSVGMRAGGAAQRVTERLPGPEAVPPVLLDPLRREGHVV